MRFWICALSVLLFVGCDKAPTSHKFAQNYTNSIGMQFVLIPSGEFMMGTKGKDGFANEKPSHKVTITNSFYLSKYEVTQEQYSALTGQNPSFFKGAQNPVENVSYNDAQYFIALLNAKENTTAYRLPTEAEWEYAARTADRSGKYHFGNDESKLGEYAWYYTGNAKERSKKGSFYAAYHTHAVGGKIPNKWGLYDMLGNVWEWTEDWYDEKYYSISPDKDPLNKNITGYKSVRGGSWISSAEFLRSASRSPQNITYQSDNTGFRVVKRAE